MRAKTGIAAWMCATAVILVSAAYLSGCASAGDRLNAPPQGQTDHPSELQDNYVRMADNALLNERSISAVHFVPGSVELNSLGVRRLNRYATLLKVYGGQLHYDGLDDEESFAKQRIEHIKDYLVASGVGPDNFSVDWGIAGGNDMRGSEASIARTGTSVSSVSTDARTIDRSRKDIIEGPVSAVEKP